MFSLCSVFNLWKTWSVAQRRNNREDPSDRSVEVTIRPSIHCYSSSEGNDP